AHTISRKGARGRLFYSGKNDLAALRRLATGQAKTNKPQTQKRKRGRLGHFDLGSNIQVGIAFERTAGQFITAVRSRHRVRVDVEIAAGDDLDGIFAQANLPDIVEARQTRHRAQEI